MKYKLIILILAIIFLITPIMAWSPSFDIGLKDYWSFDESSGTNVGNFINGSMNGTTFNSPSFVHGKVNNALQLWTTPTNIQYFNTTIQNITNLTQSYSINFWANLTGNTATRLILSNSAGTSYFAFTGDGTTLESHIDGSVVDGAIANSKDNWNMYTITYNNSNNNISIWQNGTYLTSSIVSAIPADLIINYFGTYSGLGAPLNGTLDEFGIWNRTLNASEIIELSTGVTPSGGATSGIPTLNAPVNDAHVITGNQTFNCSVINLAGFNITNMSFFHNFTGNWARNLTSILTTNTTSYNGTLFGLNITSSSVFDWTCQACFGDGSCNYANQNRTIIYTSFIENSVIFNPNTLSGALETFAINLTYDSASFTGISVLLNYNNTNYSTSVSGTGNTKIFSRTLTIPTITSPTNKTFYFIVSLTDAAATTLTSSSHNQTIYNVAIDNCTTFNQTLLNFSMVDEETLVPINGTIEITANIYSFGSLTNLIGVFNGTLNYTTGFKSGICFSNLTIPVNNYTLAYTIKHFGNASYFKVYRNVQKMDILGSTPLQNLTLYNLLGTSGFSFNALVVGNLFSFGGNSDLLVAAQKQYVGLNTFNLVESSITDSDGNALLHLIPSSDVYNFVVSKNGIVLGTFNNFQVKCQNLATAQCSITLNLANATGTLADFVNYGNVSLFFDMDKITNILSLNYNSNDGLAHNIRQKVIENDGFGNTTICDNSVIGSSGTLNCVIPAIYQNTTIYSQVFVDGNNVVTKFFTLGVDITTTDLFGVDVIIELLMYSTIVLLFLASPILIVLGAIVGITLALLLIFITGSSLGSIIAAVGFFIIAGIIIIWRISKII